MDVSIPKALVRLLASSPRMIDHEEKSVMSKITPAKIEEQTPQAISRTRSNPLPALVSMIGLLGLMAVSRPQPSDAAEQVLYSFCSQGGTNCTDGNFPNSGLIMDASGNLYGTTYGGGVIALPGRPNHTMIKRSERKKRRRFVKIRTNSSQSSNSARKPSMRT
jgi:hypothetical protein